MAKQEVTSKYTVGIGKPIEPIKPAKIEIVDFKIVPVNSKKNPQEVNDKVILICKHPQNPNLELSKVKYAYSENELKYSGLWYVLDEEKMIKSNTAFAQMLVFLGCECLEDLRGKEVETVYDDSKKFLVIKAY